MATTNNEHTQTSPRFINVNNTFFGQRASILESFWYQPEGDVMIISTRGEDEYINIPHIELGRASNMWYSEHPSLKHFLIVQLENKLFNMFCLQEPFIGKKLFQTDLMKLDFDPHLFKMGFVLGQLEEHAWNIFSLKGLSIGQGVYTDNLPRKIIVEERLLAWGGIITEEPDGGFNIRGGYEEDCFQGKRLGVNVQEIIFIEKFFSSNNSKWLFPVKKMNGGWNVVGIEGEYSDFLFDKDCDQVTVMPDLVDLDGGYACVKDWETYSLIFLKRGGLYNISLLGFYFRECRMFFKEMTEIYHRPGLDFIIARDQQGHWNLFSIRFQYLDFIAAEEGGKIDISDGDYHTSIGTSVFELGEVYTEIMDHPVLRALGGIAVKDQQGSYIISLEKEKLGKVIFSCEKISKYSEFHFEELLYPEIFEKERVRLYSNIRSASLVGLYIWREGKPSLYYCKDDTVAFFNYQDLCVCNDMIRRDYEHYEFIDEHF